MSFDFAQDPHDPDGAPLMMVGIEVGGVLAHVPAAGAWQERNLLHTDDGRQQRLKDVHQVRPDPFDHSRWVLLVPLVRRCMHPGQVSSST